MISKVHAWEVLKWFRLFWSFQNSLKWFCLKWMKIKTHIFYVQCAESLYSKVFGRCNWHLRFLLLLLFDLNHYWYNRFINSDFTEIGLFKMHNTFKSWKSNVFVSFLNFLQIVVIIEHNNESNLDPIIRF